MVQIKTNITSLPKPNHVDWKFILNNDGIYEIVSDGQIDQERILWSFKGNVMIVFKSGNLSVPVGNWLHSSYIHYPNAKITIGVEY